MGSLDESTAKPAEVPTPFGHSLPPEGPHTITLHAPGWDAAMRFRDGDFSVIAQLRSVYPRFFPFGPAATLANEMAKAIHIPERHSIVAFVSPNVWSSERDHALSESRKDKKLRDDELKYHAVDVAGIRLYLLEFPKAKMMGALFMWQHGGQGYSTRLGEYLLPYVDRLEYLGEFPGGNTPPQPTYLPEGESHELLRKRISGLLMRACAVEPRQPVKAEDIYLYQTGMAGIAHFHESAIRARPFPAVVFGAIFHSSYHCLEESPVGLKHYGKCDERDLDDFEKYLRSGGKCSYVFTEFPSNPILASVDITRLRKLADKYGFWLVVDDTVASFCNLDVLPVADGIISSLTKSFSGYADVMGGSVALNPNATSYQLLKPIFSHDFHNELFEGDADQLLKNSDDYLERSVVLNRNAAAMAAYFQTQVDDPKVPVAKVLYPPYAPGDDHLRPFFRRPTPEFPAPGYGCLLSVEFETIDQTVAFYDNLLFHHGPHLGAHMTLAMPYNAMIYGKENPEYHASYGLLPNQVRLSAGLEPESALVDVCRHAIAAMIESGAQVNKGADLASEMIAADPTIKMVTKENDYKTSLDAFGGDGV